MKKNQNKDEPKGGNNKILIISNVIFVSISIILLIVVIVISAKKDNKFTITRDNNNSFQFTNPILDCENSNQDANVVIMPDEVKNKAEEIKNKYSLDHLSLYFRDLNNGPWIGVKEKEVFSPASLLKVPVLISFLHEAEKDESLLSKRTKILPPDVNQSVVPNIVDKNVLVVGNEYNLNEVAEDMIKRSDNTAVLALFRNFNTESIGDVFKSVGVPYKDITSEVDVSVKEYAGFFRVLFNSSYLNRDMSEKALKILAESDYRDGIVAGVPKEVVVAHKFGERTIDNTIQTTQLHDCGIVYYPNRPYIICIMTRGGSFDKQTNAIREISSYIYNSIDKEK